MEIIAPLTATLTRTATGGLVYVWAAWSGTTSMVYQSGTVVRHNSSGEWRDYRSRSSHWTHTTSEPGPRNAYLWIDLGPASATTGYAYSTNVRLSELSVWATGAVAEGEAVFDEADQHDYRALTSMTSTENSMRPSSAVISSDAAVRSRWLDLGAANAWAPTDLRTNAYLEGYASDGSLLSSVVYSVDVVTDTAVDRVCFAGLINVASAQAKIYVGGSLAQTVSGSLVPTGTTYGITYRSLILPITQVAAGASLRVEITLTRDVTTLPIRHGVVCVGRAMELSYTEWGVETSILPFSGTARNETFGTVSFLKRGYARQVQATCFIDTSKISGDIVQQALSNVEGMPVYWDFNNPGATYDRLRVFGFFTSMRMAIAASTWETLSMAIEGLVE